MQQVWPNVNPDDPAAQVGKQDTAGTGVGGTSAIEAATKVAGVPAGLEAHLQVNRSQLTIHSLQHMVSLATDSC